ncbi:hypothetical protein UFOVP570_44 [uncultured Caudovirales phage]|uniref:Uncharacterized protein n=1 Tax=uncultured Caudovirales phage TaxID=2100421 RepID=A0A6J5MUW5_9CAUD|nr:hypothetical protein UFOVP570_44 [uncultured Caudovirales phage]
MAAVMSVTVGGVDLTSKILMETFTAEVGSRDTITTCSFDIRDETKTLDIKSGSLVLVTSTVTISPSAPVATVVWRGYVGNIDWAFDGAANLITVDCQSANCLLDQKAYRNKDAQRSGSRTRGAEIQWLLSNSTASEGASPINYNASKIYASATTITVKQWYGGKTLREALETFCKVYYSSKMQFWVDTNGDLNIARVGKSINMIQNWEFQLPTGAATTATNWTYVGTPTREAIAGQNSNGAGAPIAGSEIDYGLKVDSSTESAWQEISGITAGKRYYFSGAIKNLLNNRAQILLRFRASSGGVFLTPTTTITTTTVGSWVRVEQVVTAPATATHLEIRLTHSATTGGSVYYDNLQLIAETALFGISDAPNNTTTFAPMNYEESLDASAIINAVAIKGKETTDKKGHQTYYREYAPSLAYFGRVFGSFVDDASVSSAGAAERVADEIFSESALPVREGTYTISSDRLGYIVPVAGTYQIFELSRMPAARQITINRIEGLSILPFGNGEIVYEIQFGSQKGNLASALATVGSALVGTAKPRLGSTAFEHNAPRAEFTVSGRRLTDPQVTGAAAEVESPSPMPAANTPISIIKKNSALTVVQNLPDLAVYGDEFPEGTLVMLNPDAGDPDITDPTLYRSDGAASWAVASPATILADATNNGHFHHGIVTAESIFAGTIDASVITVDNINASKIKTGALTIDASFNANAITSTNFTVSNTGAVTAKDLTLIPSTLEVGGQGIDTAAGAITLEPPTAFGAVVLKVTNSNGTGDYDTVGFTSSAGAAANAPATVVTDAVHNLKVGQFVSFHSVGTTWNDITATAPIQIITTPTTTSFTVEHFAALPSVASNSAGTIRAYKRLSVRAAGGLYVYRDATNAGDIAAGSLVLGNNLANYGKDSIATVADGELGFIKATTSPRFGSGGSLYSPDGTNTVATKGDFQLGLSTSSTQGAIVFKNGTGGSIRPFSATSGNTSIGVYNSSGSAYTALVALGFYPNQGTANLSHDGTQFTMNDSVSVTGNLTTSGTLNSSNLPSYVRTAISTASTTSIAAGGFQDHTVTYTSTGSTPTVVIASVYHSGATSADLNATVWSRTASSATIRIYNSGAAASTSSRQAMVMVGIG